MEIKSYKSNMMIINHGKSANLLSEQFYGEDYEKFTESEARETLNDKLSCLDLSDNDYNEIIQKMFIYEWIINDDEVYLYNVNCYQAYRADEVGKRWMTHAPVDTEYYKHEVVDVITKHLPEGFTYNSIREEFKKDGEVWELVNEEDGSVSLVSSLGVVKWF